MSSENLITNIDNNSIYNNMDDLPILFPKKVYTMGDIKQTKKDDKFDFNKNDYNSYFFTDYEEFVKTYLYKE